MRKLNGNIDKILLDFQVLLKDKPSYKTMIEEIQMMRFRIRPVSGDALFINIRDIQFVETIWTMGKLEEIVQKEYPKLNGRGKKALFRVFEELHEKYQDQLNKLNLKVEKAPNQPNMVEIEIFKEAPNRKLN